MHDFNLKMVKILLSVAVFSVVLSTIGGISLLKNNYYWRTQYFKMQWDYVKAELEFDNYKYGGIQNWIFSKKEKINDTANGPKAKSIPILLYHGVIEQPNWKPDEVNISFSDFQDQLFALKKAGYQTISVEDYLAFAKGENELPEKSFMLTFDDGRKDSYYPVDPILRMLGYTAVMNVITGRSLGADSEKSSFHLSQTELKKMVDSGRWEMAAHTRNGHDYEKIGPNGEKGHFLSDKLWLEKENRTETDAEYAERVKADLLASKLDIEKRLGIKPVAFAYPFGDFGQESQNYPQSLNILADILQKIYPITFYQTRGSEFINNYKEDPFMTRRIDMKSEVGVDSKTSAKNILAFLDNNQDKPADYSDNFMSNKGWLQGWGALAIGGGKMTLSDTPQDDSGMTFLGGSYLWQNYFFQVKILNAKNGAFVLSARYRDDNNYIACDFTDVSIAITQRIAGQDKPDIEVISATGFDNGRQASVGISVINNQASCYLDGKVVVRGIIDERLSRGGIGLKLWDTDQKGGALTAEDLKISAAPPLAVKQ